VRRAKAKLLLPQFAQRMSGIKNRPSRPFPWPVDSGHPYDDFT
jgi:hypothetical protein